MLPYGYRFLLFVSFSAVLKNILTYNKEFPFDVQPVPLR